MFQTCKRARSVDGREVVPIVRRVPVLSWKINAKGKWLKLEHPMKLYTWADRLYLREARRGTFAMWEGNYGCVFVEYGIRCVSVEQMHSV